VAFGIATDVPGKNSDLVEKAQTWLVVSLWRCDDTHADSMQTKHPNDKNPLQKYSKSANAVSYQNSSITKRLLDNGA